ncbi:preprotein translocase subunit SecA [Candidatus Gottesmanbacteria bacterium RIFCSPHIGHO2_02_FULL_39_11]|uniref:Protein translocase subunit SecA n=1 Tax=Candidatus Gottesmanbacteria bacterium RIFCSPHIGHO2_02_FULL_39_11 TaxID=1798382 RepID=A0A1F5ZK87_9BACT|nr:MAG: preprotein translocase subunit SecA [Candidatus Gottesmanbacteria bacterium RIFCSPHIGHO2_02_FULL_39_11]
MLKIFSKIFDANHKEIERVKPIVSQINSLDEKMRGLKNDEFVEKTAEFKKRLGMGETLNDLLPEAYALVREAAGRSIGERHFDVQLIAAIELHRGAVAEQRTGEGKTLSAIPALYLNALTGRGVHLVTVNDYLARRDAGWMGPIFHMLGLSVSAIIHDQSFIYDPNVTDESAKDWRLLHLRQFSRKEAYASDITYGINSEFGFDYLRDNMVSDPSQMVQRGFHYAVVDEVDSVLIDEARTPHIISAPDTEPTQKYFEYAKIVSALAPQKDFIVDEKLRTAHLTEDGILSVEKMLNVENLYEKDFQTVHHIEAALKARALFHKEKEYIVRDNQVVIVDEFTGRLLAGRRFSEGLHQAIEAKEGVPIQQESRTLATVSLQNYFRMYEKLSGMTGTAATEAEEFHKIYNLDVIVVPTHLPLIRQDLPDMVYKSEEAKYNAVATEIEARHKNGQPVLVGTTSIDKNEFLSELLWKKGVPHEVLNAKNHEKEADIIANAGKKGAVTVATNMAGRGVDIILGGVPPSKYELGDTEKERKGESEKKKWKQAHDEVVALGGLYVLGTERHESRRIDNQLRGRSGRQGDPGASRFFVSLSDEIMRLFGGDQVARLMGVFKLPDDVPLEHAMVSRAIEHAQIKVEGFHFDTRKHLVEYDDVLNKQREIVYGLRKKLVNSENLNDLFLNKLESQVNNLAVSFSSEGITDQEKEKMVQEFTGIIPFDANSQAQLLEQLKNTKSLDDITRLLSTVVKDTFERREKQLGPEMMQQIEKWVGISVVDQFWMDHLDAIDDLREGIGLRGYGQRDPLVEYKNEAFNLFERLVSGVDYEMTHRIFKVQVQLSPDQMQAMQKLQETAMVKEVREEQLSDQAIKQSSNKKIGRNDPCWCGSGKKWKKCHYPELPH